MSFEEIVFQAQMCFVFVVCFFNIFVSVEQYFWWNIVCQSNSNFTDVKVVFVFNNNVCFHISSKILTSISILSVSEIYLAKQIHYSFTSSLIFSQSSTSFDSSCVFVHFIDYFKINSQLCSMLAHTNDIRLLFHNVLCRVHLKFCSYMQKNFLSQRRIRIWIRFIK